MVTKTHKVRGRLPQPVSSADALPPAGSVLALPHRLLAEYVVLHSPDSMYDVLDP